MFNKLKTAIKKFFSEVSADIKKINLSSIFSDYKLLAMFMLGLAAIVIVCLNLNFFILIKGLVSVVIFYFVFFWKNKKDE